MLPALLNILILSAISLIHVYWALGGRWGSKGAVPENDGVSLFRPGPVITLVVAAGLAGFAALHAIKSDWLSIELPNWVNRYGLWVVGGIFLLRAIGDFKYVGLFKHLTTSQFSRLDTRYYTPLCIVLSINTFLTILYN